ncbi:helix-turn-helix domain-containing protein [Aestuariibacter salexigens]|uniref:helix-turn-helix domain-containing protein n=1 Tax=Aestuariibacter salexigens TaxID=226010 RepID=UPI000405C8F0|nr:helix-turn-helix domain-containing protein [Aestuariibacter salexigens]
MNTDIVHSVLLVTSLLSIFALLLFKPKRLEHGLFAILALSLLLLASSELLPASFAVEQQLVALGTFATCNVFWLLARTLFRKGKALSTQHYVLAGVIALLILLMRSLDIFVSLQWIEQDTVAWFKRSLSELLKLLSSAVLLLGFWEAIRSYSSSSKSLRQQKMLFASTMLIAVISTRIVVPSLPMSAEMIDIIYLWVRSIAACCILVSTYAVLWMQYQHREALGFNRIAENDEQDENAVLLQSIKQLMTDKQLFLQPELKMIDVANALGEPEYKISKVLREKSDYDNFNHFVNHYRIEYAKRLLTSEDSKQWTILVISMESGFASLATFNRVFKSHQGCTPNQYRQVAS